MVVAHISELIAGGSTIRVFPAVERWLVSDLHTRIDKLNRVYFDSFAATAWVGIRNAFVSSLLFLAVGLLALRLRSSVLPGVLLIIIQNSAGLLNIVKQGLMALDQVQRSSNCIQRLDHYAHGLEAERSNRPGFNLDKSWPSKGKIEFRDLSMRYRPGLPFAVRDLNFAIEGGEKIGVVGRTGAGKSTIFSILLGMVDPSQGLLVIDNVDITSIGVNELREGLSVIPQEPTLFAGTIRSNLDPRNERSEEELDAALRRTSLLMSGSNEKRSSLSLDFALSPGGANLSSGQRQLLSLARAIVRNTRIILIDEATANVDYETDTRIQGMLMSEFAGRTVVTIAHRIQTIMKYDKVLVLNAGRMVEFGEPKMLWQLKDGWFRALCDQSSILEKDFT